MVCSHACRAVFAIRAHAQTYTNVHKTLKPRTYRAVPQPHHLVHARRRQQPGGERREGERGARLAVRPQRPERGLGVAGVCILWVGWGLVGWG